jgi:hypothetical protein
MVQLDDGRITDLLTSIAIETSIKKQRMTGWMVPVEVMIVFLTYCTYSLQN